MHIDPIDKLRVGLRRVLDVLYGYAVISPPACALPVRLRPARGLLGLLLLLHHLQVVVESLVLHLLLMELLGLVLLMVIVLLLLHLVMMLELLLILLVLLGLLLLLNLLLLLRLLLHCTVIASHVGSHSHRFLPRLLCLLKRTSRCSCRRGRSRSLLFRTLRPSQQLSFFEAHLRRVAPHLLLLLLTVGTS